MSIGMDYIAEAIEAAEKEYRGVVNALLSSAAPPAPVDSDVLADAQRRAREAISASYPADRRISSLNFRQGKFT
jgi:hypothetical protein